MKSALTKQSVPLIINATVMALCLLAPARRLGWTNAWALIALSSVSGLAASAVISNDAGLAAERRNMRAGMRWDKPLVGFVVLIGPIATWITAALESRRGVGMPLVVSGVGFVIAAAGSALMLGAMRANTFFSAVVRIQSDRGHAVVSTGPYRFVRHPGYVGMSAFMLATPLILASRWAFVPATLTVLVTVVRTALEDRTLQAELPGYPDYARRVPYRLVPWVW